MTDSRAAADQRQVIIREIDRMLADVAIRAVYGPVALQKLRLHLVTESEKEKENRDGLETMASRSAGICDR